MSETEESTQEEVFPAELAEHLRPRLRTPPCNSWVIPGHLMVGAFPGCVDDDYNAHLLVSILKLKISTFVCLQAEYEHGNIPEHLWRNGIKLRPYIFDGT